MTQTTRLGKLYLTLTHSANGVTWNSLRDELMSHEYRSKKLETSRRKFERDKSSLRKMGFEITKTPAGTQRPNGTIAKVDSYHIVERRKLNPIELNLHQAQLLAETITRIAENNTSLRPEYSEALERAAIKLLYKFPELLVTFRNRIVTYAGKSKSEKQPSAAAESNDNSPERLSSDKQNQLFLQIQESIEKSMRVEILYHRRDGAESRRKINPYGIFSYRNRWALVAWCTAEKGYRTFYLDRIEELKEIDAERFTRDLTFRLRDWIIHPLTIQKHPLTEITLEASPEREEHLSDYLDGLPPRAGLKESYSTNSEHKHYRMKISNKDALFAYILTHPEHIASYRPETLKSELAAKIADIRSLYSISMRGN